MADANPQASVRVSLKDGSIEIAGSEKFVHDTLADRKQIQEIFQVAQQAYVDSLADDAKGMYEESRELYKLILKMLKEQEERADQIASKLLG